MFIENGIRWQNRKIDFRPGIRDLFKQKISARTGRSKSELFEFQGLKSSEAVQSPLLIHKAMQLTNKFDFLPKKKVIKQTDFRSLMNVGMSKA